jgi:uncharacterized protein (TIGR04255 family)
MTTAPLLPDFERPPVLEVVSGVQFSELIQFQTRHFGQFWETIKNDFPRTQDAPPLPDVSENVSLEIMTLPPLRRVMFVSADNSYVLQLQNSRFHFNWRKTSDSDVYPRFNTVFARFQKMWDTFTRFVSVAGLGTVKPNRYELTYVNHIDASAQNFAQSVQSKVKMYQWIGEQAKFLPVPQSISASWIFRLPDNKGQLNANLSRAERVKRDVVVLNMACAGPAGAAYSLDEWFGTAHEWIVRGFADLTTTAAHDNWGRKA